MRPHGGGPVKPDGPSGSWADSDPRITFVAHGLGIEVDEFPFIAEGQKLPIQRGMVFAFEPKVIIPDEGVAGLENTYLVTSDGIESSEYSH